MKLPSIRFHAHCVNRATQRPKTCVKSGTIKPSSKVTAAVLPQESLCRQMCYGDPVCLAACPW